MCLGQDSSFPPYLENIYLLAIWELSFERGLEICCHGLGKLRTPIEDHEIDGMFMDCAQDAIGATYGILVKIEQSGGWISKSAEEINLRAVRSRINVFVARVRLDHRNQFVVGPSVPGVY